jgi:NAD-dependent deacetylase
MSATLHKLAALLRQPGRKLCLTGAGISVPSGIPDFRSPGGLWSRLDPLEYATIRAFHENPQKVWTLFRELGLVLRSARPNPAHLALAGLQSAGFLQTIVTQNIDGLHGAAGSQGVIELHGNHHRMTCRRCGWQGPTPLDLGPGEVPLCPQGHVPKPEVILFGENLPLAALEAAVRAAREASLIIVAGSSAEVAPASELPSIVKQGGGLVVEMNLGDTGLSALADLQVQGDLVETLPELLYLLQN